MMVSSVDKTIFISAGEASGEHYGALLISALQQKLNDSAQTVSFFGMGGERMRSAGLECVVRAEEMAVMGFTEVVRHLPRIYGEFRRLKKAIRARRPAVAVLIDFPGFHFKLAEALHREGVPVLYFVSPQLWAWKKKRIRLVQKYIDKMLVIFPFEEAFYREHGVEAEFVGHPLAELPLPSISRVEFAAASDLDPAKMWIGLLPGSRPKEIRELLPTMLEAAQKLAGSFEFILPLAPTLNPAQQEEVRRLIAQYGSGLSIRLVRDARAALQHARASIVASGTATVEAALVGNPFVVVYRVSALTYAIAKRVVKVPHVAMANLIAGKRVVPELIQSDFTAENIVQQLAPLIVEGPARQSMMEELQRVRGLLVQQSTGGAIDRVAQITLEMMRQEPGHRP
jgi:lipid-A-disaccharide synthase